MGLCKVEISNFKSIKKCSLDFSDTNILIGENGCGKTNILSAIKYFMDNLGIYSEVNEFGNIFDSNNHFSNCVKISIYFNMEKFKKIVYNQINKKNPLQKSRYQSYYKKIMKLSYNNQIKVTLVKIKDEKINWNMPIEDRLILSSLFPFYYLDSRKIDLLNWSDLWVSIGDLVKLDNDVCSDIKETINQHLETCKDSKFKKSLMNLKNIILSSIIQVAPFTHKEYSSTLTKTYLEGDKFIFNTKELSYFSNGTNSYNYTMFLIDILELISKNKLKSPIILLDEPELSLHHMLIDKLSRKIFDSGKHIKIIASTHSPRLVKKILQEDGKDQIIYNIKMNRNYSNIRKMNLFNNNVLTREKNFITDEHANAYFSKMILCVEGESELEFFSNKYIRDLFPITDCLDIYKATSDKVIENIIHPKKRNYATPYVILIDMDKVLEFNFKKAQFILKDTLKNCNKTFKLMLSYKRIPLNLLYKRINGILNKSTIVFDNKWGFCSDPYFEILLTLIKKLFYNKSTFINRTTIEGLIVNVKNFKFFEDYFLSKLDKQDTLKFNDLYSNFNNSIEKCNFLRLLCNGKSDNILNTKQLKNISISEKEKIEKIRFSKTEGWMTNFIEYFIKKHFKNQGYTFESFIEYKTIIKKKPQLKQTLKQEFILNFYELNSLMMLLESVSNDNIYTLN